MKSLRNKLPTYASECGIDKNKFIATANSFMIDSMINKGNNSAIKMQIPNTPKLIINGEFMPLVTALGSNDAVIDLTLQLVKQEG